MRDAFAAVDLGSNSFHLLIARVRGEHLVPVERVKEKVQLARGQRDGVLHPAAIERGLACVARFAQRLASLPSQRVGIVGTAALRQAVNPEAFLPAAEAAFGRPVRILSGDEEAELIFAGVSHTLAVDSSQWLVLDIGGASTEFCNGAPFHPQRKASVALGCVALTDGFFGDAPFTPSAYRAARAAAMRMLAPIAEQFVPQASVRVIGTSGTMQSVASVLGAHGFTSGDITRRGLARLESLVLDRRWVAQAGVPGLAPERVDIFPAGLAQICAMFEVLKLDHIEVVDASLQHGLLYDLANRRSTADIRDLTIADWCERFDVDAAQVKRVEATALTLFDAVSSVWDLSSLHRARLRWACHLHEIGLAVSSRHPNRHGAYLIENGDLIGFSHDDRRAVAMLVRGCRGAFPSFAFAAFDPPEARSLERTAVLLRLALMLERSRTDVDSPALRARGDDKAIDIELPAGWLARHALSRDELGREATRLAEVGIALSTSEALVAPLPRASQSS